MPASYITDYGGGGGGGAASYSSVILADTPYCYLRMNDLSGLVATDSSGNGNNGSYVTPTLGCASLVGDSTDYSLSYGPTASIAKSGGTLATSAFTLTCVLERGLSNNYGRIFTTGRYNAAVGFNFCYDNVEKTHLITFNAGAGSPSNVTIAGANVMRGKAHYAMVWTGTVLSLYVNAAQIYTVTLPGPYVAGTSVVWIGQDATLTDGVFYGQIDEYAQFHSALSLTRIRAQANAARL